jgi:hypothetical protein
MRRQAPKEMSAELREAEQQFGEWRGSHTGRRPIPHALWALAVRIGRDHEAYRTARALRLDSGKLMKRIRATAAEAESALRPKAAPATFLELMAPASPQRCECVIEVEGRRGRMPIEWKGPGAPDLASLSRLLWEPGV